MIVELNGFICHGNIGLKARSLVDLHRNGFKVPTSIALDSKEFFNVISTIKEKINLLLNRINFENIEVISKQIRMLFDSVDFSEDSKKEIINFLQDNEEYILRSSIDGVVENYAYAGLFPIRTEVSKKNIIENILECYKSVYSYNSLYYMLKNNIDYSGLGLAIIIQRKIDTNILGYVTTMNPISLKSTELSIRITKDDLYEIYCYDYMNEEFISESKYDILSKDKILETIELVKNIQSSLGYPVDIELAFKKNNIYVIQTREIKSILYENIDSIWYKKTMSSKKFMYSLVADNYRDIINNYYEMLKLDMKEEPVSLEINGCYYNVSNLSEILDELFDYDDNFFIRNLDIEYKITRKDTLRKKFHRFKNRKFIDKKIKEYEDVLEDLKKLYRDKYSEYCRMMSKVSAKDIERSWAKLVLEDYNELYMSYLDLKILVLIEKNRLYKELKPYIEISEFNELIYVKEKTYKYKVNKEYNELIKLIKNDEESYRYWFSSSTLKILKNYNENYENYFHKEFRKFIDNYGYLSFFKFDLSESFYVEDVEDVIRDIKKQLANFELVEDNESERLSIMKKLENQMMDKTYEKNIIKIERLQNLLINLSELKDYILKFNFIVKRYTKMLSKLYLKREILENESDIWYLDINTIYDYIEGEIGIEDINKVMLKNKLYYNSYRNFIPIENIGYMHSKFEDYDYKGFGISTDIVKGNVRMIKSLKDLNTLTSNDILVTKTVNNNLLFQLPLIRGIIISDFNVSSATKTTLRELRIPCIILDNCSKKLIDNSFIKMDGSTGKIKKMKKKKND